MQNFRALGLRSLTPVLPAAGGFAPRLPKQPPHCEFLATRLGGVTAFKIFRATTAGRLFGPNGKLA